MLLAELLAKLENLAKDNNISEPYIVGGLPRDVAIGMPISEAKDIDITTGDNGSMSLSILASNIWPEANFKAYSDKHSSLNMKNIRLDFSNNFVIPNIEEELKKIGIEKPTSLQKEVYSRDFTINTLLQPMDLSKSPLDLTGMAIIDIKNKTLRTPIDPDLTIGHDSRRILRAIKMAIRFDFSIDEKLKQSILKYRGGVGSLPINYIKKQINQMLEMDSKKTIELLSECKLLPIIPLSKMMITEISKNKMIQHLIDG
jgi:tRNA nucleotidyltransferase/poly(A) polymerase